MKKDSNENIENKEIDTQTISEDVLPKVGTTLKQTREKNKMKLTDIAQHLCIRRIYLEAIENNDYDNIPEAPYGIGFIRSYAEYLGLNGEQMVSFFKNEVSPKNKKNNQAYKTDETNENNTPGKKYLFLAMLVVIAVYFSWSALNQETEENTTPSYSTEITSNESNSQPLVVEEYSIDNQDTTPKDNTEGSSDTDKNEDISNVENQIVITEESFIETEDKNNNKKTETTNAPISSEKPDSRVVIKVLKETWIEVKDAEKLYISKVLQKDTIYALPNGKGMILSVGKEDGVEVWIDGKLTDIVKPNKKTNIAIDNFLSANH